MKEVLLFLTMLILSTFGSAQVMAKLTIKGVEKNGGNIYVSLFNSDPSYKAREAYLSFDLAADSETVIKYFSIPGGTYVLSIYQDSNGNKKLDTNLIGIPREKFGFSNYDGKSTPGNFNRHKVQICGDSNEVTVVLFSL